MKTSKIARFVAMAGLACLLAVPAFATPLTITLNGNFNGTAIPAGDTIWFNSVINPPSMSGGPIQLDFTAGLITFKVGATNYSILLPDATITWSSAFTTAHTTFNVAQNKWITTVPITYSGNAFLDGTKYVVPTTLAGGSVSNLQISYNVAGNAAATGDTFQWQWAAAVYTSFPNSTGVKSVDSNSLDPNYLNSDHAGTPEGDKSYVTGGAMGGGGSNFTGSYSPTGSFKPPLEVTTTPEPGSLALLGSGLLGFAGIVRKRLLR